MIIQTKALKLIKIYSTICEQFEKDLKYSCERFSNNNKQDLTDQELRSTSRKPKINYLWGRAPEALVK